MSGNILLSMLYLLKPNATAPAMKSKKVSLGFFVFLDKNQQFREPKVKVAVFSITR